MPIDPYYGTYSVSTSRAKSSEKLYSPYVPPVTVMPTFSTVSGPGAITPTGEIIVYKNGQGEVTSAQELQAPIREQLAASASAIQTPGQIALNKEELITEFAGDPNTMMQEYTPDDFEREKEIQWNHYLRELRQREIETSRSGEADAMLIEKGKPVFVKYGPPSSYGKRLLEEDRVAGFYDDFHKSEMEALNKGAIFEEFIKVKKPFILPDGRNLTPDSVLFSNPEVKIKNRVYNEYIAPTEFNEYIAPTEFERRFGYKAKTQEYIDKTKQTIDDSVRGLEGLLTGFVQPSFGAGLATGLSFLPQPEKLNPSKSSYSRDFAKVGRRAIIGGGGGFDIALEAGKTIINPYTKQIQFEPKYLASAGAAGGLGLISFTRTLTSGSLREIIGAVAEARGTGGVLEGIAPSKYVQVKYIREIPTGSTSFRGLAIRYPSIVFPELKIEPRAKIIGGVTKQPIFTSPIKQVALDNVKYGSSFGKQYGIVIGSPTLTTDAFYSIAQFGGKQIKAPTIPPSQRGVMPSSPESVAFYQNTAKQAFTNPLEAEKFALSTRIINIVEKQPSAYVSKVFELSLEGLTKKENIALADYLKGLGNKPLFDLVVFDRTLKTKMEGSSYMKLTAGKYFTDITKDIDIRTSNPELLAIGIKSALESAGEGKFKIKEGNVFKVSLEHPMQVSKGVKVTDIHGFEDLPSSLPLANLPDIVSGSKSEFVSFAMKEQKPITIQGVKGDPLSMQNVRLAGTTRAIQPKGYAPAIFRLKDLRRYLDIGIPASIASRGYSFLPFGAKIKGSFNPISIYRTKLAESALGRLKDIYGSQKARDVYSTSQFKFNEAKDVTPSTPLYINPEKSFKDVLISSKAIEPNKYVFDSKMPYPIKNNYNSYSIIKSGSNTYSSLSKYPSSTSSYIKSIPSSKVYFSKISKSPSISYSRSPISYYSSTPIYSGSSISSYPKYIELSYPRSTVSKASYSPLSNVYSPSKIIYSKSYNPYYDYKYKIKPPEIPKNRSTPYLSPLIRSTKVFDVFSRRKGKDIKISNRSMTQGEAIGFGANYVTKTLRASFKLRPAGFADIEETGSSGLSDMFYAKQDKGETRYIEKRRYRLDQPLEKQEIKQSKRVINKLLGF